MESVQLAVVRVGGKWVRFVIAAEPRRLTSSPQYWDGTKWVSEGRQARLYADRASAEHAAKRLRAKT
jgi:hypothetical protein